MISSAGDPSTVLISGGGSGIGRAAAERFIAEGWRAIVIGRRLEPLEAFAREHPGRVLAQACDLRDPASIASLLSRMDREPHFGSSLKAVVNNAGIYERRSFAETEDSTWVAMLETNLLGAVRLTRALLPRLKASRGSIVNVSSTLGLRPVAMTSAYSATKAAMVNWTQSLALELAAEQVRCNCVCPGIVDTPIHPFHGQGQEAKASLAGLQPLGRVGEPRDVAHGIWSLCAPGAEWITGAVLAVDGGISLL